MLLDENLFETQGSRLSFREFVDYLNSIGNGYHNFSRVRGDKGSGYRYTLSKPLTDEQKDYLSKYSNVDFGTAQYKYAPEIKYSTVILLDRMNKVEEDIVVEEHLGRQVFATGIHLRLQPLNIRIFVSRIGMHLRVAGTSYAEISVFLNKTHQIGGVRKICKYFSVEILWNISSQS